MYLKVVSLILVLCFIVDCKEDPNLKACTQLENLFKEICKVGGDKKVQSMKKASECYIEMIPKDADKNLKEYFEKKCGPNEDYCDDKIRKRCGPDSFNQMDEKQKEGALNFYEKHQKGIFFLILISRTFRT